MKNQDWNEEVILIKSILDKAGLDIAIKWGIEVYTYEGRNIVGVASFKNFVSLWFYNGVFLKDRYQVLVNASEGKTKSMRQWRFSSLEEIEERKILEYIAEAIQIEQKGLKIKPEKFKAVPVPTLLKKELEADKKLKASFEALTPGKQKEYILYLQEAKQEATKIRRLDKIKPMIKRGVGLNDKYK